MQVGNAQSQSQSLLASVQMSRTVLEMQKTLEDANGTYQSSLLVDVVEVDIEITGEFANRVLQDSLEEKLNAAFQQAGLDTSVESLLQSGMDFSPQATAERIVGFSLSFFGQFQLNHAEEEGPAQVDGFVGLIKGAIEEGFAGAQELLAGLGQIAPEVQAGIEETFALVMENIDKFAEEQRKLLAPAQVGEEESEKVSAI
jgi:hypothetical protein